MAAWFKRPEPPESAPQKSVAVQKRRATFREAKEVCALVVPASGGAFEIKTIDLSVKGLSFESPRALIDNEKLVVKFTTDETRNVVYTAMIHCRVVRVHMTRGATKKILVGVEFAPMSVVENLGLIRFFLEHYGLHFLDPSEKRRNVRLSPKVSIPMEFLTKSGQRVQVFLRDISLEGLGFIAESPFELGETLSLSLRTGEDVWVDSQATVMRVVPRDGGRFEVGARFAMMSEPDRGHLVQVLTKMGHVVFEEEPKKAEELPETAAPQSAPSTASPPVFPKLKVPIARRGMYHRGSDEDR